MLQSVSFARLLCLAALAASLPVAACKKADPTAAADKPAGLPAAPTPPAPAKAAEPAPTPEANAAGEADVVPDAPDPAQSVSGNITVTDARRKDVKDGETMWLVVRRGGGQAGPPLAIQRLSVATFPLAFTVSGRDAMIKGMPFAGEVDITVRVDRDGNPMTHSKGEVYGTVKNVKVGSADVTLALDSVQTEDVSLGGARPAGGALPPGHP